MPSSLALVLLSLVAPVLRPRGPTHTHSRTHFEPLLRASPPPSSSSTYQDYINKRGPVDLAKAEAEYRKFKGIDQEFDGGDSGGGVVGDGNVDLEDQHNSPSIVRGGFDSASRAGGNDVIGRGNVKTMPSAREMSAKGNYFGRTTGYAEQLIEKGMDPVRAQQLENWHNQNDLAAANRQRATQGTQGALGQTGTQGMGKYKARYYQGTEKERSGRVDGEVSQRELADHLQKMMLTPANRLDGEEWGEIQVSDNDEVTQTFSVKSKVGGISATDILVKNDQNTFAPFRCGFTADSSPYFSATPYSGTMNRRDGDPISCVIRFQPKAYGEPVTATFVFETEDMKKIYKFIGST